MKKLQLLLLFLFLFHVFTNPANGQNTDTVPVMHIMELSSLLEVKSDTPLVVNFWATWCKPCVEELPGFLSAEKDSVNQHIKFVYLSLDFKRDLRDKLVPFASDKGMLSRVFLFDEPDYNSWIDKIDPSWQGSIPATLILDRKNGRRHFHEGILDQKELQKLINHICHEKK